MPSPLGNNVRHRWIMMEVMMMEMPKCSEGVTFILLSKMGLQNFAQKIGV